METAGETKQQSRACALPVMPIQRRFTCGLDSVFAFSTKSNYLQKG